MSLPMTRDMRTSLWWSGEVASSPTKGQISWERLVRVLMATGEIRPNETVTDLVVTEQFLQFAVITRG